MRLASPSPGFCSVCFGAKPDMRFIDCEADYDGAPVLDKETRTIAVIPWTGLLGGHDNLHICESCVREMSQLLGQEDYKEVIQRQARMLQRLELTTQIEREARRRAEVETAKWREKWEQATPLDTLPRGPGRPRKVAA